MPLLQFRQINTTQTDVEDKISDICGLATVAIINTKIDEVANKIPDTSRSRTATTALLNPFWSSVTFLYPLKIFSGGIEM